QFSPEERFAIANNVLRRQAGCRILTHELECLRGIVSSWAAASKDRLTHTCTFPVQHAEIRAQMSHRRFAFRDLRWFAIPQDRCAVVELPSSRVTLARLAIGAPS